MQICGENQNKFYVQKCFPQKPCSLWGNVATFCGVGQATDKNKAHAHCVPDT